MEKDFEGNAFKFNYEKEFEDAIFNGDLNKIKYCLNRGFDPTFKDNLGIIRSVVYNDVKIVKLLLEDKRVNPSIRDNFPIRQASSNGRKEIVKLLLKDERVDPSSKNNQSIINANKNGHRGVVKLLFKDNRVRKSLDKKDIKGFIEIEYKLFKLKKLF